MCAKEHIWRSEEWELVLSFYPMDLEIVLRSILVAGFLLVHSANFLSIPHSMRGAPSLLQLTFSVPTLALADVHVFAVFGAWSSAQAVPEKGWEAETEAAPE